MQSAASASARSEIAGLNKLPPLSATASRLLELLADPDLEVGVLCQVIDQDPGLAARILGLANSAFFAQRQPVMTIKEAVIRILGLNLVKGLALSMALAGAFDAKGCKAFDIGEYWFTALGSAQIGRDLALSMEADMRPDPDRVYMAGLFHNLGSLVLAHLFPDPYSGAITRARKDPNQCRSQLEREACGLDSAQAGGVLAKRWHLPEPMALVMGELGNRAYSGKFEKDLCLISSAVGWLDGMRLDTGPGLSEDSRLLQVSEISRENLQGVEQRFMSNIEELKSISSRLV